MPPAPDEAPPAVQAAWRNGIAEEIAFWRMVALPEPSCPPAYREELLRRCDPDHEADAGIMASITTAPPERAVIVDVAAGPVSSFGWHFRGARFDLRPIDALAEDYAALMAEAGLAIPVPTRPGHAEALGSLFAPASVDLVHVRNGLDHCYDPGLAIAGAMRILKPDGALWISGYVREGEKAGYQGLHQWNLDVEDGRAILWRPGRRVELDREWPGAVTGVEAAGGWAVVRMRRPA